MVAKHLVQALAMCLKIQQACPLTPMHIEGKCNAIADTPSRLFGSIPLWKCETDSNLLTLFNSMFHLPNQQSWTVFQAGQLEVTAQGREAGWQHSWCTYVYPLGVDPYLQQTQFQTRVRCLTGFAARTRSEINRRGQQVHRRTVISAITAIGKMIALACNNNPTKVNDSDKL